MMCLFSCSTHVALLLLLATSSALEQPMAEVDADTMAQLPSDPQTLSQMLQWSLDHTDLEALHKKAEAIRAAPAAGTLSADGNTNELGSAALPQPALSSIDTDPAMRERLRELSDMTEALMPNQVVLMRQALEQASNQSASDEEREEGLLDLQELVSDIDNAKDLKAINEYPTVLAHLISEQPAMQTAAAWVIGSAVQNHRELQLHILSLGTLPALLNLIHSHESTELRAKALYAASALLRNCPEAQMEFIKHNGIAALVSAMSNTRAPKIVRKSLVLLTDLLDEQLRASAMQSDGSVTALGAVQPLPLMTDVQNATHLCDAIADSLSITDTDAQEKAVMALHKLSTAATITNVRHDCNQDAISVGLSKLQHQCEEQHDHGGLSPEVCQTIEALMQHSS